MIIIAFTVGFLVGFDLKSNEKTIITHTSKDFFIKDTFIANKKGSDIIMELSKEFGDKIKGSIVINMEPIEKPGKYKINVEASSTKKEINILVIKQ